MGTSGSSGSQPRRRAFHRATDCCVLQLQEAPALMGFSAGFCAVQACAFPFQIGKLRKLVMACGELRPLKPPPCREPCALRSLPSHAPASNVPAPTLIRVQWVCLITGGRAGPLAQEGRLAKVCPGLPKR